MQEPQGRRISVDSLELNTQRYLANHLLKEIKRHNWKRHTRPLWAPPNFRILGAGQIPIQDPPELLNKYCSCVVIPEPRLGITNGYAMILSFAMLTKFFAVDMDREGLWWGWVGLLSGPARKAWYMEPPDEEHPLPRMRRNHKLGVTEEGAQASVRLLHYAEIVQLSAKALDEHLILLEEAKARRMKRLPDNVIEIIEAALARPKLPRAA